MNLGYLRELGTLVTTHISSAVAKTLYTYNAYELVDLGPYGKWKIGPAQLKQSDHQEVTLFIFEKLTLDEQSNIQAKLLIDLLRNEALMLQKLRHPNLLSVVSPLAETRAGLSFAVKPISSNLADVMHSLSILEVKAGLLDIGDALAFLHKHASLAHLNVNPWSIYVDRQGGWHLGGTAFATVVPEDGRLITHDINFHRFRPLSDGRIFCPDPPVQFAAPEQTQNNPGKICTKTDVFAFGILAYQTLSLAMGNKESLDFLLQDSTRLVHASKCSSFAAFVKSDTRIESEVKNVIGQMLHVDPSKRPAADCLKQSSAFNDVSLRALKFIERFSEKDDFQKRDFLKALPPLLDSKVEFQQPRLLQQRVLPILVSLLTSQHLTLWPLILRPVLSMARRINDPVVFQQLVWPKIMPLLSATEIQVESVLLFVEHIDLILSGCTDTMSSDHCIPFVLKCLSLSHSEIQKAILGKLSIILKHFESSPLQRQVLPQVLALISNAQCSPQFRASGLLTLAEMATYLDRNTIITQVLPAIQESARVDRTPETALACFKLVNSIRPLLSNEVVIQQAIPIAMPILANPFLDDDSFSICLKVINDSIDKYAEERQREYDRQRESHKLVSSVLNLVNPAVQESEQSRSDGTTCLEELLGLPSPPSRVVSKCQNLDLINLQSPENDTRNDLSSVFVTKAPDLNDLFAAPPKNDPFAELFKI